MIIRLPVLQHTFPRISTLCFLSLYDRHWKCMYFKNIVFTRQQHSFMLILLC